MTVEFTRNTYYHYLYFKSRIDKYIIVYLLLYIDDMLLIDVDLQQINVIKETSGTEFEMKNLGHVKRILVMDIVRKKATTFVNFETISIY